MNRLTAKLMLQALSVTVAMMLTHVAVDYIEDGGYMAGLSILFMAFAQIFGVLVNIQIKSK